MKRIIHGGIILGAIVIMTALMVKTGLDQFEKGWDVGFTDACEYFVSSQLYAINPERHQAFVKEYGAIKLTPWNKFTIEEKMLLCAIGSEGNRLSATDMFILNKKYGPPNTALSLLYEHKPKETESEMREVLDANSGEKEET